MQEVQLQSLGWEDPLEEDVAIHPSILAWRIPWTEDPGGLQSMGSQLDTTERLSSNSNGNQCGLFPCHRKNLKAQGD